METPSRCCLGDSVEMFPVLRFEVNTGVGDANVNNAYQSGAGTIPPRSVGRAISARVGVLACSLQTLPPPRYRDFGAHDCGRVGDNLSEPDNYYDDEGTRLRRGGASPL